jgi:hypothetical protein
MKPDTTGLKSIRLMTKILATLLEKTRIPRPLPKDVKPSSMGRTQVRLTMMMILMGIERAI